MWGLVHLGPYICAVRAHVSRHCMQGSSLFSGYRYHNDVALDVIDALQPEPLRVEYPSLCGTGGQLASLSVSWIDKICGRRLTMCFKDHAIHLVVDAGLWLLVGRTWWLMVADVWGLVSSLVWMGYVNTCIDKNRYAWSGPNYIGMSLIDRYEGIHIWLKTVRVVRVGKAGACCFYDIFRLLIKVT